MSYTGFPQRDLWLTLPFVGVSSLKLGHSGDPEWPFFLVLLLALRIWDVAGETDL